ncbi:CBS domain-containing protein [Crocinitomicaceae bacterium]|nr:CBS domain-containing protein [Crocinitomicaceae bacterium]
MASELIRIIENARPLISANSQSSLKDVYTKMISKQISLIPIIDNNGKNYRGYIRQKDLFKSMINDNFTFKSKDINDFLVVGKELRIVNELMTLNDLMEKLNGRPSVLIRDESGKYTGIITPRVLAEFLFEYSERFILIEKIENKIRERIKKNKIQLNQIINELYNKPLPRDANQLDFGQYVVVLSKKWEELGLNSLSKKEFFSKLDSVRKYRNALMHFKSCDHKVGIENSKALLNLLN